MGEAWNKFHPLPQGLLRIPRPPTQAIYKVMDKGLVAPPPLMIESQSQNLEDREYVELHADEVSKEGKIV